MRALRALKKRHLQEGFWGNLDPQFMAFDLR